MADIQKHHRMFLQAFMWKKICSASQVRNLYRVCCSKYNVQTNQQNEENALALFVNKINHSIRSQHMAITKGLDEETGANFYALINRADNSISRLSSDYSVNELELFKKIVGSIVESEEGKISSVSVLNLTHELEKPMTIKDAEELLSRFLKDKWLFEKDGRISLSTRSMIELDYYLRMTYEQEIKVCPRCKDIVIIGQTCEECDIRLHNHCANNLFKNKENLQCPNCNAKWPHLVNVSASSSTANGGRRQKTKRLKQNI